MPRSDVSARRTSGDAILGSGHAGGRLDAVTSLDTPSAPLQLEHAVGAVRLLVGGTHGWPGHAADQRALARGLQREQEVYPRPCMRLHGFCASTGAPIA